MSFEGPWWFVALMVLVVSGAGALLAHYRRAANRKEVQRMNEALGRAHAEHKLKQRGLSDDEATNVLRKLLDDLRKRNGKRSG